MPSPVLPARQAAEGNAVARWSARPLAVLALVLAILTSTAGPVEATHAWSTYHWATTTTPFTLQLGNNLNAAWSSYLTTASNDWGSTKFDGQNDNGTVVRNPLRTVIVAGAAKSKRCGAVSGRVEVCNGTYGQTGWLGIAQIWLSNGHIVQGTTKLNDSYFNTATYSSPNEKLHVVCQEVGHTFGLDHQSTDGSSLDTCMDYFSNTGANAGSTASTHPNLHDYGELTLIYAHSDGYNSYTSAVATAALGAGGEGGADGHGTPAGASRERGSWYVQDLGRGVLLVTHVYWAERGN